MRIVVAESSRHVSVATIQCRTHSCMDPRGAFCHQSKAGSILSSRLLERARNGRHLAVEPPNDAFTCERTGAHGVSGSASV